ncbi:stage II sporulation protein D [Melghirimyces profundicolus]|uniref:Stage II sporulation protein D n=1 Tax=Melghirimyces profundicolus TaxID=1242148 RepID=A0A2T6C2L3_9BACL|nr:stage II sporulation protein D [Melghirimyces profundicolus]PTX62533.1 stage II sporulation protein D [Melghirimyces profundicolus]
MHKGMILLTALLIGVMVAVPAILVSFDRDAPYAKKSGGESGSAIWKSGPIVKVYLTKENRVEKVPLEAYIRGVVAAEMPADFHVEALKAQSLAARTYIGDRLSKGKFEGMAKWGGQAKGAHVSDTVDHQVYLTDEKLKEQWGDHYRAYSARINQAVRETRGKMIFYGGKPIYAAFFSTSNGQTENSEDYFSTAYPYLRSVPSPWDKESPKFRDQKKFELKEFISRLSDHTAKEVAVSAAAGGDWLKVTERTDGGRVSKVRVGDQEFTGRQVREALELPSADFNWKIKGGQITFTTEGYGHGVGMSQWGAHLMAQRGEKAEEIIRYYYRGVDIAAMDEQLAQKE